MWVVLRGRSRGLCSECAQRHTSKQLPSATPRAQTAPVPHRDVTTTVAQLHALEASCACSLRRLCFWKSVGVYVVSFYFLRFAPPKAIVWTFSSFVWRKRFCECWMFVCLFVFRLGYFIYFSCEPPEAISSGLLLLSC